MLNMGFQDDVEAVLANVPENRQTMMFSATMPQWIRKLARKFCRNHIIVDLVGEHDTGVQPDAAQAPAVARRAAHKHMAMRDFKPECSPAAPACGVCDENRSICYRSRKL